MVIVLQEYIFELKNEISELKALNRYLNNWGDNIGLLADSTARINICLDELFTNIVSYGFEDNLKHIVKFTLNGDNHLVIISIEDESKEVNKALYSPVDFSNLSAKMKPQKKL